MDQDLSQTIELSQCSQEGEKASSRSRRWSYRRSTLDHPYEPDLQLKEDDHSNGGTCTQVGHNNALLRSLGQIIIPLSLALKAARYILTYSPTCMIRESGLDQTIQQIQNISDLPCTPMYYIDHLTSNQKQTSNSVGQPQRQ